MYVALNPNKVRNFTTKGIHLTLSKPIGYVPDDLEGEFQDKVNNSIREQELFVIPDNEATGLFLPGIGSTGGLKEESTVVGDYTITKEDTKDPVEEIKDVFGNTLRVQRRIYTLKLPDLPDEKLILTDRDL